VLFWKTSPLNTSPLDEERDFARKTNQLASDHEALLAGNQANQKAITKHKIQANQTRGFRTMLGKSRIWKGLRNLSLGIGIFSTAASGFGLASHASKPLEMPAERTVLVENNESTSSNGTTLSILLGTAGILGTLGFVGAHKKQKGFSKNPQTQQESETYQRHLKAIEHLSTKSISLQPASTLSPSEQKLLKGLEPEVSELIMTYQNKLLELADPVRTTDPNLRAYLAKLFEVDLSVQSLERQTLQRELNQLNVEIASKQEQIAALRRSKHYSGQFQLPVELELYTLTERQRLLELQLNGGQNVIQIPTMSQFENLFKYLALLSFQDPVLFPQSALSSPSQLQQDSPISELTLMTRIYTFARLALSEGNLYQFVVPSEQNPYSQQGLHPDMIGLLQTQEQQVCFALKQRDETDKRIDHLQHGVEKAQKAYGQLCLKPETDQTRDIKEKLRNLIEKMQASQHALKKELAQPISQLIAQNTAQGASQTVETQQLQDAQLLIEELNLILVEEETINLVKTLLSSV
jgi:hypothetical protein